MPRHEEKRSGRGSYFAARAAPLRQGLLAVTGLHFADERTFLFGPEAEVRSLLERTPQPGGPWQAALRLATRKPLVVAGFYPPDLLEHWLGPKFTRDKRALKPLLAARSGVLTVDLEGEQTRLGLVVDFSAQTSASLNEAAVKAALALLEKQLSRLLAVLVKGGIPLPHGGEWWQAGPRVGEARPPARREHGASHGRRRGRAGNPAEQPYRHSRRASAAAGLIRSNDLKHLAFAMLTFAEGSNRLPPAAICDLQTGKPLLSWRVALLPYLEQQKLYKEFKLNEPWDSPHNIKLLRRMPRIYADEGAEPGTTTTFFRVVVGKGTVFEPFGDRPPSGVRVTDILDGTSNTLLIAEAAKAVPWTKPDELIYDPTGPLPHFRRDARGGFHAALADGSVRFIPLTVAPRILRALITRNDGQPVELP